MHSKQPKFVPDLKVGMTMQCAFRNIVIISEDDEVELKEWCTYTITKISSGNKLLKTSNGQKYHKKDGSVEAKWNDDVDKEEENTCSVVLIKELVEI